MNTLATVLALLTPPLGIEYSTLVPGVIVSIVALGIVLLDVFHRAETSRDYLGYVGAVGLSVAIASCWFLWDTTLAAPTFHGMLYLDRFGLFFAAFACISGIITCMVSPPYLRVYNMDRGEYYMLVLLSVVGMIFMANAADLLTIFIALEVMSIPVYVLAAFLRTERTSAEAGLKYFILGAFSAALLLFGIALIYGITGTTNLEYIGHNLASVLADPVAAGATKQLLIAAILLILSGFAFKIAAVPFHIWTPDVYTGTPTPGTGFMATGVKAAAFAALLRVFIIAFEAPELRGGFFGVGWVDVLLFLSGASIVLGNFAAIVQKSVKRMLAYSSIAHAGYILVGVVAANAAPQFFLHNDTILFYLVTYLFATLGAFGVLSYLARNGESASTYDDLNGIGIRYPFLGVAMSIFMLSSAGIPPTAGFVGKLYVFRSSIDVGQQTGEFAFIAIAILGVLASIAGIFYYLRVMVAMYMREPSATPMQPLNSNGARAAIAICAVGVMYIGLLPAKPLQLAREAVVDMQGAPASVQPAITKGRTLLLEPEPPLEVAPQPAAAAAAAEDSADKPVAPLQRMISRPTEGPLRERLQLRKIEAAQEAPAPAPTDSFGRSEGDPHFGHNHE